MTWTVADRSHRPRVVIMVSRFAHCLVDLLFRASVGELSVDVVAVVSNHPDLGRVADSYGVRFVHIPVTPDTKADAEAALLDLVEAEGVELVVLARYMQILTDGLCRALPGRAINNSTRCCPASRAPGPTTRRTPGVKFIGATAHYVTADWTRARSSTGAAPGRPLAGPDQLAARRPEAESRALARAVRWHTETRSPSSATGRWSSPDGRGAGQCSRPPRRPPGSGRW